MHLEFMMSAGLLFLRDKRKAKEKKNLYNSR